MPERTNSGLMGLPRIRTSVDHLHGSEDVPLINRDPSGREKKSNGLTRYVVPALGGALASCGRTRRAVLGCTVDLVP